MDDCHPSMPLILGRTWATALFIDDPDPGFPSSLFQDRVRYSLYLYLTLAKQGDAIASGWSSVKPVANVAGFEGASMVSSAVSGSATWHLEWRRYPYCVENEALFSKLR